MMDTRIPLFLAYIAAYFIPTKVFRKGTFAKVLLNTLIVGPSTFFLYDTLTPVVPQTLEDTMGLNRVLWTPVLFIAAITLYDIFFWCMHYGAHRWAWSIHKVHHSLVMPKSGEAFYCHPLEQALVNVLPFCLVLSAVALDFWDVVLLTVAFVASTTVAHTYDPLGNHSLHHLGKKAGNFGVGFYLMDRLAGTYFEPRVSDGARRLEVPCYIP